MLALDEDSYNGLKGAGDATSFTNADVKRTKLNGKKVKKGIDKLTKATIPQV